MENLELTHINEQGRACMVDVTQKDVTFRRCSWMRTRAMTWRRSRTFTGS